MARGGVRQGAGRPKASRTIEKEKLKDYIAEQVALHGPEIVSVLLDKARQGDVQAIRELFDRGFGKPSQAVDVTTKGEPIVMSPETIAKAQRFDEWYAKHSA